MLMVPIVDGWAETLEVPATTDADRVRLYGQHDHVRLYGRDFPDRVAAAGFDVDAFVAHEPQVSDNGLARGSQVFFARRR